MKHLDGTVSQSISEALAGLQGERTDQEFAALLGCTRSHWSHIRSGRRQISYAMAKRVSRRFPAIAQIVLRDFVSEPVEAVAS